MLKKLLRRTVILGFVIVFCQFPFFVNEYLVRLGGHLSESNLQIQKFQESAALSKKSLDDYIAKFLAQKDEDFQQQGSLMKGAKERNDFLREATTSLENSPPFLRPLVFIRHADISIVKEAWATFSIGINASWESLLWACVGFVMGYITVTALQALYRRPPFEGKEDRP